MKRREFITLLGGAAGWPVAARAATDDAGGGVHQRPLADSAHLVHAFRQGLSDIGFVEGQNIAIEFRWARGQYDRLRALAADLVERRSPCSQRSGETFDRLQRNRRPDDPDRFRNWRRSTFLAGLVDSFNQPGGTRPGIQYYQSHGAEAVALLSELVPGAPASRRPIEPTHPREQHVNCGKSRLPLGEPVKDFS